MTDQVNIVVRNQWWSESLERTLFGPLDQHEGIVYVPADQIDMWDLLVTFGFFESKGQARKNWKRTGATVPSGFNDFFVGKLKRRLTIWNPVAAEDP